MTIEIIKPETFFDINCFKPYVNKTLIVETPYGRRMAILPLAGFGYRFIDCTHPLQNTNLPPYEILGWKYKDESLNVGRNYHVVDKKHPPEPPKQNRSIFKKIYRWLIKDL
jgi:hypothetical protein